MDYELELKVRAQQVNILLEKFAPAGDIPPLLKEAMEYSLYAGGKRIRPVLLMETV
ncbi:MAG: geranyl transferase, partial [Eubacteriaceae bacterium]|nr:geranyl transferase [Eubacteriaceae bacterium]